MAVESDAMTDDVADEEVDEANYYEVGVDDYLSGPFDARMFTARIRSHMRRSMPSQAHLRPSQGSEERIEIGPLKIDQRFHSVTLNGQVLTLTAREFALLDYFCRHPNQVFSRNQLLSEVWGYDYFGGTRTVDVHVRRLRAKLGDLEQLIGTVRNVGYRFNVYEDDAPPPRERADA